MSYEIIIDSLPRFFDGLYITLWIIIVSLILGSALALPLALVRVYKIPCLSAISRGYSYVLRGTPLLVQIYLLYYGLSQFEAVRESWLWYILEDARVCLLFGFSLNLAAYMSEIIRGALEAVPKGELEAARAYGMSELRLIWSISLPSALCRSIPALSNQVIFLVHSSALASAITVIDLLGAGRELNQTYYVAVEGFLTAAVFYMVLILIITLIFRLLENRYAAFLR